MITRNSLFNMKSSGGFFNRAIKIFFCSKKAVKRFLIYFYRSTGRGGE